MTEDYTDVYHDDNGTVIPEESFAPTAEDVEKLLSGSVEDSPSFAKLLNGEKQKHAGLSKSLELVWAICITFFTREERRKIKRLIEKGYSVSEAMDKTI